MFYNISGLILDRLTVTEKVRQEQKKRSTGLSNVIE